MHLLLLLCYFTLLFLLGHWLLFLHVAEVVVLFDLDFVLSRCLCFFLVCLLNDVVVDVPANVPVVATFVSTLSSCLNSWFYVIVHVILSLLCHCFYAFNVVLFTASVISDVILFIIFCLCSCYCFSYVILLIFCQE